MSAAGVAARDPDQAAGQVGEILTACRLAPGALLMLGWQRELPSSDGPAALHQTGAQPGRFKRVAWTTAFQGRPAYCFLAALHLPSPAIRPGDTVVLAGWRSKRDEVLARLPGSFLDASPFALQLAHAAAPLAGSVVARFLIETLLSPSNAGNALASALLLSFLNHASTDDGCVELLGGVRDHCALLQGWGRPLQGGCDAVLVGTSFSFHPVREAIFMRPDIAEPATGQALVLAAEAIQARAVECVFLLAHDGIRRRPILAERRLLSEAETTGHLRDLLAVIRCDADTRARLVATLRPRFDGQLTLYERGHPIRLTIDLAVNALGAGCYLTGWMYDPARIVTEVRLRSTLGACVRVDDRWTRILRPDVTAGFATDLSMPPCEPGSHHHGFAVHEPRVGAPSRAEQLYLEVELQDGWCGFIPLICTPIAGEPDCARLLASVDLYLPSTHALIHDHVAPFLSKIAAPSVLPSAAPLLDLPTLIVVPLNTVVPPRALLSHLLAHPLDTDEGLVLLCSAAWSDREIAALDNLARFYGGNRVTVRRIEGVATVRNALLTAATQSTARHVLLLGDGAVGTASGWRRSLQEAAPIGAACCVSPTVLYEDRSIRFAGATHLETIEKQPFVRLQRPLAGLPANFAPPGPAVPTAGISLACCLFTREALDQVAQRPTAEVAAHWAPEFDLMRQVQGAGIACLWAPNVQVYAPDLPSDDTPLSRARTEIGGWSVRVGLSEIGK